MSTAKKKAEAFLRIAKDFQLGALPTEARHNRTVHLAELTRTNIPKALSLLRQIDLGVIEKVIEAQEKIASLQAAVEETLAKGRNIYIYGCGATGRLALSLENLWRACHRDSPLQNRVRGFMSGGDLALVHSIEHFEDHAKWGARQVREIGFDDGDLLLACTEGGETPSVIGAVEEAARISRRFPWFLYCNPDEILLPLVERSRHVHENPSVRKFSLPVGPMSLSGSTRLQATTALMLLVGKALFPTADLSRFCEFLASSATDLLATFAEKESDIYAHQGFVLYETNHYGITILTDTTERSPTFSLPGFENLREKSAPSLCYLSLPACPTAEAAWEAILLRPPHTLEWRLLRGAASHLRLLGFDFSGNARSRREVLTGQAQRIFRIDRHGSKLSLEFEELRHEFEVEALHPLCEQIFLKLLLNAHSTVVMGRIGRFESNVMTWVKPSNNKLVDRAIRYVIFLLQNEGMKVSYSEAARELFATMESLAPGESVVERTTSALRQKKSCR